MTGPLEPTRRERRAGSRRARQRTVREKRDKFLALREQGATRAAISAALNLSLEGVAELESIAEREEGGEAKNA